MYEFIPKIHFLLDPHGNCGGRYTNRSAAGYYRDLAEKFGKYNCQARSLPGQGGCNWQLKNCDGRRNG